MVAMDKTMECIWVENKAKTVPDCCLSGTVFCRIAAMGKTMECIWVGNKAKNVPKVFYLARFLPDDGGGQDYGMYLGWGYD